MRREIRPEAFLARLPLFAGLAAGDLARAWPLISDELRSTVAENILCSGLPSAPVFASTLGDDTRLMGALSLVRARKFASVVPA